MKRKGKREGNIDNNTEEQRPRTNGAGKRGQSQMGKKRQKQSAWLVDPAVLRFYQAHVDLWLIRNCSLNTAENLLTESKQPNPNKEI